VSQEECARLREGVPYVNIGLKVTESEVVDWIHAVQIRDYWWSAVNIIEIVYR
jgi:hypothetical protein